MSFFTTGEKQYKKRRFPQRRLIQSLRKSVPIGIVIKMPCPFCHADLEQESHDIIKVRPNEQGKQ